MIHTTGFGVNMLLAALCLCVATCPWLVRATCDKDAYYGDLLPHLQNLDIPYPALAQQLNELLVSTHHVISYNGAWEALSGNVNLANSCQ